MSLLALGMFFCTCLLVGCGGGGGTGDPSLKYGENSPTFTTANTTITTTTTPTTTLPQVVVSSAKMVVEINTITGQVSITPLVISGKVAFLVNASNEPVLDSNTQVIPGYRIAWNDNGSWYPAGGKVSPLVLPKTTIDNATKPIGTGAGMPYLLRPDGAFASFNTSAETCTFLVDGKIVNVGSDGLVHY